MNKKVSIIMPVYNGESFLNESIQSVLEQSYPFIELIIVNDNSPDNSEEIIKNYLNLFPDKIKYVKHKKNLGGAEARNTGISIATGDYISFIDQDDIFLRTKIEEQLSFLLKEKVDLCCCGVEFFKGNKKMYTFYDVNFHLLPKKEQLKKFIEKNLIPTYSAIMATAISIKDIFPINSKYIGSDDYEFWLRYIYKYNIGFLNKILVKKREHSENLSWKKTENMIKERLELLKLYSRKYKVEVDTCAISNIYFSMSLKYLVQEEKKRSFLFAINSLKICKKNIKSILIMLLILFPNKIAKKLLKVFVSKYYRKGRSRWLLYLD